MKQTAEFEFATVIPEANMCLNKVPNFWQLRYSGLQHYSSSELTT